MLAYIPFMYIGWLLIPITMCTIFKNVNNEHLLALISAGLSFTYCWIFIIPSMILFEIPFLGYLIADIPFEVILASSSYISVLFLYKPLMKIFKEVLQIERIL